MGSVYRVSLDGRVACHLDSVSSPNGFSLVMNVDESMLYVAGTHGNFVLRVPFARDGGVAKVGI